MLRTPMHTLKSLGYLTALMTKEVLQRRDSQIDHRRSLSTTGNVQIAISARAAYDNLSNVSDMGLWSPENTGATIRHSTGSNGRGMVFYGHNQRGKLRWTTRCRVVVAKPGECFSFKVEAIGPLGAPFIRFPIATWTYRFQSIDDHTCNVSERWAVGPWPWPVIACLERMSEGGLTMEDLQTRNINITLQNLKTALENSTNTPSPD